MGELQNWMNRARCSAILARHSAVWHPRLDWWDEEDSSGLPDTTGGWVKMGPTLILFCFISGLDPSLVVFCDG
jgi:hypothetical protein